MSSEAWYAIRVKPRHEKSVAAGLLSKEVEHFLPLHVDRRKWADRYKNVSLPLFPGYIFAYFDLQNRAGLLKQPGVVDLVRFGTVTLPVDSQEIEALRALVESGMPSEPLARLAVGQEVEIMGGPLFGKKGVVFRVGSQRRLALSVKLLNRSVVVDIDHDWVVSSGRLFHPHAMGVAAEPRSQATPEPQLDWNLANPVA